VGDSVGEPALSSHLPRRRSVGRRFAVAEGDPTDVAPGMGAELGVKVPYGSLLEETMSRRQLHEPERGAGRGRARRRVWRTPVLIRDGMDASPPARSCGMEALDAPQHRAKAKLRKAFDAWVSVPSNATPSIQSRHRGTGDGGGVKLSVLTRGDLHRSARAVGGKEATTTRRCRSEKSDHLVVVMKPGNAGGAKGVTG
jgi:hypothetical protein